jgi:hypothetical protein
MLKSSSTSCRCAQSSSCAVKSLICQATISACIGAECGGLAFHTGVSATLPSVMYYFTVT